MNEEKRVQELIKQLKDHDEDARANAAEALGNLREKAADAVPALIGALKKALNDEEGQYVQSKAAHALGKIGEKAIPELIQALKDKDERVREWAAVILGEAGEKAVPALIGALKDHNARVRKYAADALANFGEKAVPVLVKTAREQPALRTQVQKVLKDMKANTDLGIKEERIEAPEERDRFNRVLATRLMKDTAKPNPAGPKKVKK